MVWDGLGAGPSSVSLALDAWMASPLIIFPTSLSEPWRILAELRTILGQDHPLDLVKLLGCLDGFATYYISNILE